MNAPLLTTTNRKALLAARKPEKTGAAAWLERLRAHEEEFTSMRTSTRLPFERVCIAHDAGANFRASDVKSWQPVPYLENFINDDLRAGLDTDVRAQVAFDGKNLHVRCSSSLPVGRTDFVDRWYEADTFELYVDAQHDHQNYFQFAITPRGKRFATKMLRPLDSLRCENKQSNKSVPVKQWKGSATLTDRGWSATFQIPFKLLGRKPGPGVAFGFNLQHLRCSGVHSVTHWNHTFKGPHAPSAFGQLRFEAAPLHVEQVDLGDLQLWENRGSLEVRNTSGRSIEAKLLVSVNNGSQSNEKFWSGAFPVRIAAAASAQIPFSFHFNADDYRFNHLHLAIESSDGAALWNASYHFGRGIPGWLLPVNERRDGPVPKNPPPSDPDFMRKKRSYIIRTLPRFVRRTTAQGAPSDFTLQAEDRGIIFDLMRPGVLKEIADFIYRTFDNDTDRLLGALFFVHQTDVVTYANSPSGIVTNLSPLSVLRFGSGQCCCFATALLGIVELMHCDETGGCYRGTRVCLPGHVTTAVEFQGRRVNLDASLGRFYFHRDNKTLASVEELMKEPALAARTGRHLEEFHRNAATKKPMPHYYAIGQTVWPIGAPAE